MTTRRITISLATLALILGTASLDVLGWHLGGCVTQAAGSSWSTGYCAPDPSRNPVIFWDVGPGSIDIGGYWPLGVPYDTTEQPWWEIYATA